MILQPLRPVLSPIARSVAGAARGRLSNPSLMLEFAGEAYSMGAVDAPLSARAFNDLITFTRSSGGGVFNAQKKFEWLPANQPRFDFDPVTGEAKGLLIEEQRTNLLTESEFRNGLSDSPSRGGLVSATAFSGFAGGIAFGHNGTTSSFAYKTVATTAATTYTLSVFVRMDDGGGVTLGAGSTPGTDFTLVYRGGTYTGGIVTHLGGGLYRASLTVTSSTGSDSFGVVKYAAQTNRTFKVTGYQLEAGPFASSYIPTTTAQVTRAADVASVNVLSPWYNQEQGTLFVEGTGRLGGAGGTGNGVLACIGTVTEYSALIQQTATAINGTTRVGGANTASISVVNPQGISTKSAFSFKQDSFSLAVNGVLGAQVTSGGLFNGIGAKLNVGNFGGAANFANGHIRAIKYLPRRVSNSELQTLTAN